MNILKEINTLLLCSSVSLNELDTELQQKNAVSVSDADLEGFLHNVFEYQKKGHHILIASNSPEIIALGHSLNLNLQANKLAFWSNGAYDLGELSQELSTHMIHTEANEEFYPHSTQHPAIFCENGRVFIRNGLCAGGVPLYAQDGNFWGTLLPQEFHPESFIGTLYDQRSAMTAEIDNILRLLENETQTCSVPESVLLFRGAQLTAVPLTDAEQITMSEIELFIRTGLYAETSPEVLLTALSKLDQIRLAVKLADEFCRNAVFA